MDGVVALNTLLDDERDALLKGDMDLLAEMLPKKEALIGRLNASPLPNQTSVQQLGGKVRRNQVLLDSALDGLRAAVSRVAVLREMQSGMDTYGADGQKRQITTDATRSVERRA